MMLVALKRSNETRISFVSFAEKAYFHLYLSHLYGTI
jgi:hypothetical protein